MKNQTPFREADRQLEKILKTAKKEFNRNRLRNFTVFDEINIIRLKKSVARLYKKLDNINRTLFLAIAREAYAAACSEAGISHVGAIGEKWLISKLASVDPVTGYEYPNETQRKRDRFYESLLAAMLAADDNAIEQAYKKAFKLWSRQTEQYEINTVKNARRQAFEDGGIESVMWITQRDDKVCGYCDERDGQIYGINEVPTSHYNCRCYTVAV